MVTIWFRPHDMKGAISTEVNATFAPHVWDLLAKQFYMVSERP